VFTQCDKCETIFRLSALALRTAGGQVRCGRCGEVFNALTRLAEDATGFNQGESPLDLEARADEILHTVEPYAPIETPIETPADGGGDIARLEVIETPADGSGDIARLEVIETPADSGGDIARLEVIETPADGSGDIARLEVMEPLDDEAMPEGSLEFTLPPGELDRVFIETTPSVMQLLAAERLRGARGAGPPLAAAPTTAAPVDAASAAATPPNATRLAAPPIAEAPPAAASGAAPPRRTPAPASGAASPRRKPVPAVDATGQTGPAPMPSDPIAAATPGVRITGFEVSEDVRQEMLSGFAHAELPQINAPQRRLPALVWAAAAVLLALVLAGQLLLRNREWLSAHVPALSDGAPAALSAYQLQQWGVTGEPGASGTLRVRATIMNTAAQLQPYPLLRVTLANRFGAPVAERDFEPSEYLGKTTARMLSPGERANATLDILDPGKDAEGFEIDLCLRAADAQLRCAGDAATRAR
jgi:predicted Zn finger-like uncharacterized protein